MAYLDLSWWYVLPFALLGLHTANCEEFTTSFPSDPVLNIRLRLNYIELLHLLEDAVRKPTPPPSANNAKNVADLPSYPGLRKLQEKFSCSSQCLIVLLNNW